MNDPQATRGCPENVRRRVSKEWIRGYEMFGREPRYRCRTAVERAGWNTAEAASRVSRT